MKEMETLARLTSYEQDFHQWTLDTAEAIRRGRLDGIEWNCVAEELEGLARSDRRELSSRLGVLIYHLLKLKYQPERESDSWHSTMAEQGIWISNLLADSPSLKSYLRDPAFWARAYKGVFQHARLEHLPKTVIDQFPESCPYSLENLQF